MTETRIMEVAALDCVLTAAPWDFAVRDAAAIDRHWAERRARTPDLFNGRVLVLEHGDLATDTAGRTVFRGACMEVDFKAFLAWRDFGYPGEGVRNCFSMAALETADGAFVLGEMAAHTATAGQIYFPAGTPDRNDVFGDIVDIEGSAGRELLEETGLGADLVVPQPGLTLVTDQRRVCAMKRMRSPETATTLVGTIEAWLARDPKSELTRMHVVREPDDITAAMPSFVAAYLRDRFARR